MALLNFRQQVDTPAASGAMQALLQGYSIEVMPRTAAKIDDFRALLPVGTRVYIAHIDGTPLADMVTTAARLRADGFAPMPHIPARLIRNRAALADLIARYRGEAGVTQALLLAGGVAQPAGDFASSMQLMETGLFDGFRRLHLAGHPEGNRDIDRDGGDAAVMEALRWKQDFANRTDAEMAIVTQFAFEAAPLIAWADRLAAEGITLPIHLGIAGPAKLQTMLKFAIACGVGPSLRVLQKRAKDVTKLLTPFEPTQLVRDLAAHKARHPDFGVQSLHFFPLGGIVPNARWAADHGAPGAANR
ncbi:5,10-methylenetetrahydrofolate reductase [Roseicitreum antarcticum]|uniref:Methylenetetrahydrofolate reductase (NADPH) n=1 Tax=Roseicitreum antarcticum TaxID=564137 RepID=A0A1H2W7I0_9RHOB|nr:5,10-methylenetetrahydrofolate reductase [Roseicitreum antarcticum]SDW76019.1 methylenetetrahydrofolate reductase (NADPH) [Roseicitreum antarcticum]